MITFSYQKTNLDLVLKKNISTSGSIFNTKSTYFQRSVPAWSKLHTTSAGFVSNNKNVCLTFAKSYRVPMQQNPFFHNITILFLPMQFSTFSEKIYNTTLSTFNIHIFQYKPNMLNPQLSLKILQAEFTAFLFHFHKFNSQFVLLVGGGGG